MGQIYQENSFNAFCTLKKSIKEISTLNHWLEMQPLVLNQTSKRWKCQILNCRCASISLGDSYRENKNCYENIMARAFNGRIYKLEKFMGSYWKVMFSNHDLKHDLFIMTPWLLPIFISFLWKPSPCCFQIRSCFHCSYNQTKWLRVWKKMHQNGPIWWHVLSETTVVHLLDGLIVLYK